MDTLAKRLHFARSLRKLTQTQLSELSGVTQSDISKLERGDSLKTTNLLRLASSLDVNPQWLDDGGGAMESPDTRSAPVPIDLENNPDYPAVRRVSIKAQAGASGFSVDEPEIDGPPIVFRASWYKEKGYVPRKMIAVRVTGASMEPNMYEGDLIVINTAQPEPKDGKAFLANYEGEIVVKRLVRDDGLWWLSSDNQDQRRYPRKVCNEHTVIIGEVVYRQTERV